MVDLSKRRILLVDDEDIVRQAISFMLRPAGCVIVPASSGGEALKLFQPGAFDLVITDLRMPDMDGGALASEIKRRSASQPILMLTAFPEELVTSGRNQASVDLILEKPFEPGTLRAAISKLTSGEPTS
jgi:CheY-like chemotaxis protein